jgi:hypothetical protein
VIGVIAALALGVHDAQGEVSIFDQIKPISLGVILERKERVVLRNVVRIGVNESTKKVEFLWTRPDVINVFFRKFWNEKLPVLVVFRSRSEGLLAVRVEPCKSIYWTALANVGCDHMPKGAVRDSGIRVALIDNQEGADQIFTYLRAKLNLAHPNLRSVPYSLLSRSYVSRFFGIDNSYASGKGSQKAKDGANEQRPRLFKGKQCCRFGGVRRTTLLEQVVFLYAMLLCIIVASISCAHAFPSGKRPKVGFAALSGAGLVAAILLLKPLITAQVWVPWL